jgi:hypothetical protein
MSKFTFVRRANINNFVADQTVTIGAGGGTDTVENVPTRPDAALEIQLDDGSVFVILGYLRK